MAEQFAADPAGRIGRRIDALPMSRRLWTWVFLISVGGLFEIYDMALTAPLSAALVAAHIFHPGETGLFGLADQATFVFATFSGLYIGVLAFSAFGDRLGRRSVFAISLIWYAIATLVMGLQNSVIPICLWRFLAGVGLGAEAVAIDCFLVELVPSRIRGRAFAISMGIQYCGIPLAAFLAVFLVGHAPLGIDGWRWLTFMPVIGAIGFWDARRRLPESPRWLAQKGRVEEAARVVDLLDDGSGLIVSHSGLKRKPRVVFVSRHHVVHMAWMMLVYFNLQNIAFYGFGSWLPTLIQSQGANLKSSLFYSAGVALAAPTAPLLLSLISDRFERKHLIIVSGLFAVVAGLSFAYADAPLGWVVFGIGLTLSNSVLSVNSHNYLSELFPTRIRARMVGFLYSFTRLSAAVSGYIIAYVLAETGVKGVFALISTLMIVAISVIGLFGPRTSGVTFDEAASDDQIPVGTGNSETDKKLGSR
ncbi:MFS transporter [Beijerinckia indica]|uniref:Major facilitator superfamily MFS_1 n=1 Tax=Beijerinckia indica subsp. indica (strain ATCC 9039 / DSM 1715 / NCIMB 8712) TaxID=395963 RepID=B2IIW0_BEII9|nr:MFS transporter [Beijerinckia indica]ACB96172.1 major facilitator superfamily MFS_1 [Beijerinckia indica subsp. indica ATCC 9039]